MYWQLYFRGKLNLEAVMSALADEGYVVLAPLLAFLSISHKCMCARDEMWCMILSPKSSPAMSVFPPPRRMASADNIFVTGCSAGGLSTYLHSDFIAQVRDLFRAII
jgi:dienelactone hydrolase